LDLRDEISTKHHRREDIACKMKKEPEGTYQILHSKKV
jgi:hypothetical protein